MSITYCEKHDRHYDTDYFVTCRLCEEDNMHKHEWRYHPAIKVHENDLGFLVGFVCQDRHCGEVITLPEAEHILNSHADLLEALEEIAEGKGAYSLDKLTHAHNVIENLVTIAKQAIEKAK